MLQKRPVKNVHIYVLKDPETGEVRYVGKTKLTLKKRLQDHLSEKTKSYKYNWITSLKNKNVLPIIESIERVSNEVWAVREMFWIQHYKDLGARLTNSNDGGLGGHNPSAEVRAKISAANKNRSAETRAKIGATRKGQKMSAETRTKLSTANKGKTLSPEHRAKLSTANKGKTLSPEHRANMSAAAKNRSAEHTAKLIASRKANRERKNKIPFSQRKNLTFDHPASPP